MQVDTSIPETAVYSAAGDLAVKFYKQVPRIISCNGSSYAFTIRANISLSYIKPTDYPCMVLKRTRACCGNTKKPGGVLIASGDDVRRWTNGGGR